MANVTVTASAVRGTGQRGAGTAGETIAAGDVIFQDAADLSQYKLTDINATGKKEVAGIALHGSLDEQPVQFVQSGGELTLQAAALTPGVFYYASATPGKICPYGDLTTGDTVIQLGYARLATVLVVNIINTGITL
jgi:hypothetical protein